MLILVELMIELSILIETGELPERDLAITAVLEHRQPVGAHGDHIDSLAIEPALAERNRRDHRAFDLGPALEVPELVLGRRVGVGVLKDIFRVVEPCDRFAVTAPELDGVLVLVIEPDALPACSPIDAFVLRAGPCRGRFVL